MALPTAVFIVPGFAGSGLLLPRPRVNRPPLKVWISYTELGISGLDDLQLDGTGLNPGPLAAGPLVAGGWSIDSYYLPLESTLSAAGYQTIPLPYDWRLSTRLHAGPLLQRMLDADALGPWAVVAHSMGAMQTLLAWSDLAAAGKGKNCRRVLWVDPALGGSYAAAYCLAGGHFDELSWGIQVSILQGVTGVVTRPNHFLYPLSQRVDASVASWPGLYELLPSAQGPFAALDADVALFYTKANWDENAYIQQQWLYLAAETQARVVKALAGPLPPSVVVRSSSRSTLARTPTGKGAWADALRYPASLAGDGTLLWVRSSLPGVAAFGVGSTHPDVCADPQFRENAADLIEGGLVADSSLPPLPTPGGSLKPDIISRSTIPGPFPMLQIRGDP